MNQEIKHGDKNTIIGWIPEDWLICKLNDVSEILFSNVDKKLKPNEKTVYLCNYMDVYKNDYIDNNLSFMKATANENEIKKFKLKKYDVIITKDSETRDEIAVPAVVIDKLNNVICGYHLAIIRPKKKKLCGIFLMYQLYSYNINSQFIRLANGITRFGLNISSIKNSLIALPFYSEQQKIAQILSTWDKAIELTQNLITAKEQQKNALMQQLLTGKKRFKEFENNWWNEVKLGVVCDFTQGEQVLQNKTYSKFQKGRIRYLYIRDFFTNKFVTYVDNKYPDKIINEDEIMMVNTGNTAGLVYRGKKGVLCNNAFKISVKPKYKKEINKEFLWQYLNSKRKEKMIKSLFNVAGQPHVGHKNVALIKFPFISYNEQQKIASVLQATDKEIDTLKKKLEFLQKQKKGLMQVLLTGKIRVKVDE